MGVVHHTGFPWLLQFCNKARGGSVLMGRRWRRVSMHHRGLNHRSPMELVGFRA